MMLHSLCTSYLRENKEFEKVKMRTMIMGGNWLKGYIMLYKKKFIRLIVLI